MRLATEIYTKKITESKNFYCKYFGFKVKYEVEGYVILQHKINTAYELLFCVSNSPFVNKIFRTEFSPTGMIFQMEVENIEQEYGRIKELGLTIVIHIINEAVNGKHFTIIDPNGIYIDIVQYAGL